MSSGQPCKHKDCTFYRSANKNYCSQHTPEGMARVAARIAAKRAEENAKQRRFNEMKPIWDAYATKLPETRVRLVLGAAPHEERVGRTHYDDPNTYLLGMDHEQYPGVDYSRYILCDFTNEHQLAKVATEYPNFFDEIAFDWSTMCGFGENAYEDAKMYRCLYRMLRENGVLYVSDSYGRSNEALQLAGFNPVLEVRRSDLTHTLVDTLLKGDRSDSRNFPVPLGIKTTGGAGAPSSGAGAGAGAPSSGGKRSTRRRRRTIRRRNRL